MLILQRYFIPFNCIQNRLQNSLHTTNWIKLTVKYFHSLTVAELCTSVRSQSDWFYTCNVSGKVRYTYVVHSIKRNRIEINETCRSKSEENRFARCFQFNNSLPLKLSKLSPFSNHTNENYYLIFQKPVVLHFKIETL